RKYPLTRFTLDQMLNAVRLEAEEESEMSLELLSFGVDAVMDYEEKHAKCLMLMVKDLMLSSKVDEGGKGFSRVETPLFEGMLVVGEIEEHGDEEEQDNVNDAAQGADTAIFGDDVQDQSIPSPTPPTLPPQPPQDIPSTS
nr:hypothetical protein [Tanacetum cinerariifolium]